MSNINEKRKGKKVNSYQKTDVISEVSRVVLHMPHSTVLSFAALAPQPKRFARQRPPISTGPYGVIGPRSDSTF